MPEKTNSANVLKGLNYVAGQVKGEGKNITKVASDLQKTNDLIAPLKSEEIKKKLNSIQGKVQI